MNKWIATMAGCGLLAAASMVGAQQPAPPAADEAVVARIGDEVITESQLESMVGSSLLNLRQQIYQAKVQTLENQIFNRLVGEAATAEGLTRADYLTKNVDALLMPPTEEEINKIFTQFRARLGPDDEQAKKQVTEFLAQQARATLAGALREELFAKAGVQILLEPPRVQVAIGEGTPSRGPVTAPIVVVEYTDFQCPFCVRVQPTLDAVRERYGDQVVHVFKNLPLPIHAQAQLAGEASLCAQDQDKFWEFHKWLFQNQRTMNRASMIEQAGAMGMNSELFTACLDQNTYRDKVRADMKEARSFGITGTPGFLINGRVLSGAQPLEAFEAIIDEELGRKGLPVPAKKAAEGATETQGASEAQGAEGGESTS